MSDVQRFIDANLGRFRTELHDFLRIPSVSADPQHNQDTRAAAEWLSSRLTVAGLKSTVFETAGHPIVLAERRTADPNAPTVLIYGHTMSNRPPLWSSGILRHLSRASAMGAYTPAVLPTTKVSSTCM